MKGIVVLILSFIVLTVVFILIPVEKQDYIYICTDMQGNVIYCIDIYKTNGGMFGTKEDGTEVTITSYKRINKEGDDEDE